MDPYITYNNNEMDPVLKTVSLQRRSDCKICMSNQVGVVFLPCGHLISCVNCSPKVKDCPFCRQFIKGKVKTYMS